MLAPPTESQFKELVDFLLSLDPNTARCPLPINITEENRWRWHAYEGMADHHIFKYRHEIPQRRPRDHCSVTPEKWPELGDQQIIEDEMSKKAAGEPHDDALVTVTEDRLRRTTTPTSRVWHWDEDEIAKLQPDKKKQGRPPYFFDP